MNATHAPGLSTGNHLAAAATMASAPYRHTPNSPTRMASPACLNTRSVKYTAWRNAAIAHAPRTDQQYAMPTRDSGEAKTLPTAVAMTMTAANETLSVTAKRT